MKKFFYILIFLIMAESVYAHNEKIMNREIHSDLLTETWFKVQNNKSDEKQYSYYLDLFLQQLKEKDMNSSIQEFTEQGKNIISDLINLTDELMVSPENYEELESQIVGKLFEYAFFQQSVSDYKIEKLLKLNIVSFFILVIFILTTIVFSLASTNAWIREKRARAMNNKIIQVQEAERKRISNDLHDTITQNVRTALIYVREVQEKTKDSSDEIKDLLERINNLETQNLKNIRNIIHNLTPPEIESANFRQLIADYCSNITEMSAIPCKCYAEASELYEKLTSIQKLNLFRIIQESITNSVKYSGASEISVIMRSDNFVENKLIFFISDNGSGFDTENFSEKNHSKDDIIDQSTHLGIEGIKNRARHLNADLKISSDEETGTEIRVELVV